MDGSEICIGMGMVTNDNMIADKKQVLYLTDRRGFKAGWDSIYSVAGLRFLERSYEFEDSLFNVQTVGQGYFFLTAWSFLE